VTAAFALLGESEWAARLVPITCSISSVILLWLLVRSTVNRRAATLTAAVFATLPMELHYGDMVDFEPCLLMGMLAVLLCLRYWCVTGHVRWKVLAAVSSMLVLWMDWPGYLFVMSLAGYFILSGWKGGRNGFQIPPEQSLRFGLLLLGLVGLSGVFFLLQIRYVRADAWLDLWNAATMRLSNSTVTDATSAAMNPVHFTFRGWCEAILHGLTEDFLPLPWFFAAFGIFFLWKGRRESDGLRWCAFALMPMIIAGVLYVAILRNESYVHDFATFYLIGVLALVGGLGLEGLLAVLHRRLRNPAAHAVTTLVMIGLFAWLGASAVSRAESLRSQFYVLDAEKPEPPDFIPSLGRFLGQTFPFGTTILCNFAASGTLDFYAQRNVMNALTEPADWKAFIADLRPPLGGIIWLDAPEAAAVVSSLPREEVQEITFQGYRFALWRAKSR
jgi:4-amino-4-deoxy-L-arabinose transferase-like glycosyltransferase